ncbi:MAG: 50S ribosomal protein L5 [Ignavibacteria bacterium]|nr:50S ribosomal protein L5 [Ignavibacteria bacterium]
MAETKKDKKSTAAKPAAKSKKEAEHGDDPGGVPRLFDRYKTTIVPELMKQFSYKSVMQVPHLRKISINMGVGDAVSDAKLLDQAVNDLEQIAGQKVVITKAKKSISNFKLREGMQIGVRVTLRSARMYEFLDRFISTAIPRIRDFRGVSDKSFDGRGNYTIGVKEQIIFPEIDVDKITKIFGMDITLVTSAPTDEEAMALLQAFGLPFRKKEVA